MLVVALTGLVIVAKDAFTFDDKGKPVFEVVGRPSHGARYAPYHEIHEGIFSENMPFPQQHLGLHVGVYTNGTKVLSIDPTLTALALTAAAALGGAGTTRSTPPPSAGPAVRASG